MAWNGSHLFSSWFYGLIVFSGLIWEVLLVLVALIHASAVSCQGGWELTGLGWPQLGCLICSIGPSLCRTFSQVVHLVSYSAFRKREREREKEWSGPLSFLPHAVRQSREEEEGKKGNKLYILLGETAQLHYKGCWRSSFAVYCKYLVVNIYKALSLISWASW